MIRPASTLLAVALAAFTAGPLAAQDDTRGWWLPRVLEIAERGEDVRARPDIDDRRDREGARRSDDARRDDRWDRGRDVRRDERGRRGAANAKVQGRKGNGPPFCRSGQGHPVHGWEWCERKGWGGAYGRDVWSRGGWEDVIFRRPAETRRRMEQPTLGGILGDIVMGRLTDHAGLVGLTGAMDGRWLDLGERGGVLQVRAGGVPLAELADLDRDGRAELVLLSGGR